jgi:hypothetical protein
LAEVQQGYTDALNELRKSPDIAPTAEVLKAIHQTIFGQVLKEAGDFRQEDTIRRLAADKEKSICKPEQVEHEVGRNAKDVDGLLAEKDPEKQIEKIALCHAGLVTIHAFKDIGDGGPRFVNRTIAAVFSEAQLDRCFGQQMARSVESAVYEQGINSAIEGRLEALVHVVKVLGGPPPPPANVQALDKVDSQIEASNRDFPPDVAKELEALAQKAELRARGAAGEYKLGGRSDSVLLRELKAAFANEKIATIGGIERELLQRRFAVAQAFGNESDGVQEVLRNISPKQPLVIAEVRTQTHDIEGKKALFESPNPRQAQDASVGIPGVLATARANDDQQADEGGLEGPKNHSGDVQGLEKRSPENRARLQQLSQRPPEIKELHAKVEQGLEKRSAVGLARLQQLSQRPLQNKERDPNDVQGLEKRSPENRARLQQLIQSRSPNRDKSRDPSH